MSDFRCGKRAQTRSRHTTTPTHHFSTTTPAPRGKREIGQGAKKKGQFVIVYHLTNYLYLQVPARNARPRPFHPPPTSALHLSPTPPPPPPPQEHAARNKDTRSSAPSSFRAHAGAETGPHATRTHAIAALALDLTRPPIEPPSRTRQVRRIAPPYPSESICERVSVRSRSMLTTAASNAPPPHTPPSDALPFDALPFSKNPPHVQDPPGSRNDVRAYPRFGRRWSASALCTQAASTRPLLDLPPPPYHHRGIGSQSPVSVYGPTVSAQSGHRPPNAELGRAQRQRRSRRVRPDPHAQHPHLPNHLLRLSGVRPAHA